MPSVRSGSGLVNTSSVGMLGMCSRPQAVSNAPPFQSHAREQADGQIGARADEVQRVELRAP